LPEANIPCAKSSAQRHKGLSFEREQTEPSAEMECDQHCRNRRPPLNVQQNVS